MCFVLSALHEQDLGGQGELSFFPPLLAERQESLSGQSVSSQICASLLGFSC